MKNGNASSLRDLCLNHFQILRIPITPNDLDAILERADKQTLSHLKFLDLLLGQQAAARRDRAVERRIREADFEKRKTLDTSTGSSIRRSTECKSRNSPPATSSAANRT